MKKRSKPSRLSLALKLKHHVSSLPWYGQEIGSGLQPSLGPFCFTKHLFSLLGMLSWDTTLPTSAWRSFAEYPFCGALFTSQVHGTLLSCSKVCVCVCDSMTSGSFVLPNAPGSHACENIFLSFLERKKGISTFPD